MIGVFDSGIGGLSVLREIHRLLPHVQVGYFSDRAHLPYGERDLTEIAGFCRAITHFFIKHDAKIIVIACNTASAAALYCLRQEYPQILFVGMEPAIKPAAQQTKTGKIGVLATTGTLHGAPYSGVVRRFAGAAQIFEQPCPGLAAKIETGAPESEMRALLDHWITPLKNENIDQLILACTHYPLILPLIREIAGEMITVIDPAPAIACRVRQLLNGNELTENTGYPDNLMAGDTDNNSSRELFFYTSALPQELINAVKKFMRLEVTVNLISDLSLC